MEYRNHHQKPQEEDGLAYINPPPPPMRFSAFSDPPPPPPPPPPALANNGMFPDHRVLPISIYPSPELQPIAASQPVKYRECLRNHAASHGGHVLDGCGEFMSEDETGAAAMKCAACGCHRSFHRKESLLCRRELPPPPPPPPPSRSKHHPSGVAVGANNNSGSGATTESSSEGRLASTMLQQQQHGMALAGSKKRHRTKFTAEQKERMVEFAERVGWRFNRQDETEVENLCREIGVRRHVLKVWMHNNKHSIKNKQQQQQQEAQLQPQQSQQFLGM